MFTRVELRSVKLILEAVRACPWKCALPALRLRKSTRNQHQLIIQVQYTLLIPTFYDANFSRFSVSKLNEEAKRSMTEWQEKLDKVTKDSEERISELQQKLAKVRDNIHELKHAEIVGCLT